MFKTVIALAVAAGFATASFAQGTTPATPAAPAAVTAEKKVEAPKAAEPVKAGASKVATPTKAETPKVEAVKHEDEHSKAKSLGHKKTVEKAEHKDEVKAAPATK